MNYRIVGNDGKIYGPVTAEQIRLWLSERRADSRTPVLPEGAGDWVVLGLLPEFAADFPVQPPPSAFPTAPPVSGMRTNGFAIWGFICGLISCTCICCCGWPLNILGLIFSLIALAQINANPAQQSGKGLAIAGLVCSAVSMLAVLGFFLVRLATHQPLWQLDGF